MFDLMGNKLNIIIVTHQKNFIARKTEVILDEGHN